MVASILRKRYTEILMHAASLTHLCDLCLALPETTQAGEASDPSFRVLGQTFATGHRVGDRESVWFKASNTTRQRLLHVDQQQFFKPPYVGKHGWLGAWLDDCDWSEIDTLLKESYLMTAPSHLREEVSTPQRAATLRWIQCRQLRHRI